MRKTPVGCIINNTCGKVQNLTMMINRDCFKCECGGDRFEYTSIQGNLLRCKSCKVNYQYRD